MFPVSPTSGYPLFKLYKYYKLHNFRDFIFKKILFSTLSQFHDKLQLIRSTFCLWKNVLLKDKNL
ncbi:hypothetical protein NP493_2g15061 [Ridgeia piscesae]|uniref:Uncharacterized protein n=1 Tax=Ridgeia piscesae TaxID=27915 RepID=A0AAD9ULU4_RIDPI|nr:hypothetical protein NP493_2g15061 [Ridgeia piscesae]